MNHNTIRPILVTGATGAIGREVVGLLRAEGRPVRAAAFEYTAPHIDPNTGAEAVPFDFARLETFGPALAGVERLFLMRPPALSNTRRYMNPFIDAAQAAGVQQIVFLSLLGAEKNRVVPHRQVEDYLRATGAPWTLLRPSFFMQNLSTTHRADIAEQGEILVPAGDGKTSFIDARDIAAVAAKTLTEPGHIGQAYSLTGGEALDYTTVAQIFTAVLGRKIVYRRPSIPRFVRAMRRRGVSWSFIGVMVGIYTTCRLGLAATVTPDAARLLGRAPITMRQFVEDYRDCWLWIGKQANGAVLVRANVSGEQ